MVVAMRRPQLRERPAAVHGAIHPRVQHVDRLGILRIGVNVRVVPGALAEIALLVRAAPRIAAVVGSEDASRVRLHDSPYAVVVGGHSNTDLPDGPLGESLVARDLLPRVAAVAGLEESGARPAARHVRWAAARLPDRRIENPRIDGVHGEIHGAGGIGP